MLKIKNIFNFLKIILKNNKKRIISLFGVYFIINIIFVLLLFIFTNFYNFLEENKKYTNELSLKKNFDKGKDKDIYYKDFKKVKEIIGNNGEVFKSYFLKMPTYLKIKFFTKRFETDFLLHIYDFKYLGIKNNFKNGNLENGNNNNKTENSNEVVQLVFSNKTLLLLENVVLSNLNYENIIKFLEGNIYFGKNSFSKQENIINKNFRVLGFNDKLAIYSVAVDEKQIKKILPEKFFNDEIKLYEINIKFKNKKTLIKYKKILEKKGYNFLLKNKEFEKTNKKLNLIYYYFFIPVFIIFFILLNMIINLNLDNSILKNRDIILNLKYLKINKFYLIFIFYLEYLLIFLASFIVLILLISGFLYFYGYIFNNNIIFKYFNLNLFLYFSLILYFIVLVYSFMKISFRFFRNKN